MLIIIRLTVALVTFTIGIAAHLCLTYSSPSPVSSLDERHRLYEAAAMTGDSEIRTFMFNQLTCMNADGTVDAQLTEREGEGVCVRFDGTVLATAGNHFSDFMREHQAWSSRNLSFLGEVDTPAKARNYFNAHR